MKKDLPWSITLTLAGLAVAGGLVATAAGAQPAPPPGLRPAEPIVCTGNQTLTIRKRYIATAGNAAQIGGNCEVRIVDSHFVASDVAIRADGNAEVHIERSTIEGAGGALRAAGNATISYVDSQIHGRATTSGLAELIDGGGNTIGSAAGGRRPEEPSMAEPRSEATLRVGGIEIGAGGVRVGGVRVDEDGVDIGGGAVVIDERGVAVGDGAVVVDDQGVAVGDGAVVVDREGYVRIESGTVSHTGDWRSRGRPQEIETVLVELAAVTEPDGIRLELAGDVLFDFGRAELRRDALDWLSRVAHLIRAKAAGQVTVIGHTDSIGAPATNQALSQRRALAVLRWLHEREGIPASLLVGRGLGETRPITYNTMPDGSDNPEGRARNRRVEIWIATAG